MDECKPLATGKKEAKAAAGGGKDAAAAAAITTEQVFVRNVIELHDKYLVGLCRLTL